MATKSKTYKPSEKKDDNNWGLLGAIGLFGLLGGLLLFKRKPSEPDIVLSDLVIAPLVAYKGQQVVVSCTATNVSDEEASLYVIFKVGGTQIEKRLVSLAARTYDTIVFVATAGAARTQPYNVNLNELSGFFYVISNYPIAVRKIEVEGPEGPEGPIYEDTLITFRAFVTNLGNVNDSRDLTLAVEPGGYSQTRNSGIIVPGATAEVEFKFAIAEHGTYIATIELVSTAFAVLHIELPPQSLIYYGSGAYLGQLQQRSAFYAEGNFLQFFDAINFTSSPNGKPESWRTPELVMSPLRANDFWSTHYSPIHNCVEVVGRYSGVDVNGQWSWMRGVPRPDGSITWTVPLQNLGDSRGEQPCVTTDIYGTAWLAAGGYVAPIKKTNGGYSWTPVFLGYGTQYPQLLPLTNGDMIYVAAGYSWAQGGDWGWLTLNRWSNVSQTWSPLTVIRNIRLVSQISSVAVGSKIYSLHQGYQEPLYLSIYDAVTSQVVGLESVTPDLGVYYSLSADSSGNLIMFWYKSNSPEIYMRKRLANGTYTDIVLVTTDPNLQNVGAITSPALIPAKFVGEQGEQIPANPWFVYMTNWLYLRFFGMWW